MPKLELSLSYNDFDLIDHTVNNKPIYVATGHMNQSVSDQGKLNRLVTEYRFSIEGINQTISYVTSYEDSYQLWNHLQQNLVTRRVFDRLRNLYDKNCWQHKFFIQIHEGESVFIIF